MPATCKEVFTLIEDLAPRRLAESWDRVGLQVGDPRTGVSKVLLTLDVTPGVVEEAKEKGAELIVSHHPLMLKPLTSICLDRPDGELIATLIRSGITVYAAHTNLDIAPGGVSFALAKKLGLGNLSVLHPTGRERYLKLAVFVPEEHLEPVRLAILEAGAGWIGRYSHCSFKTQGTGTFKPLEGTRPYIGSPGHLEQVAEFKLETALPAANIKRVIGAMLKAHPYEEVAYDVYPLEKDGPAYGLGMVGTLPEPLTFRRFVQTVREALSQPGVKAGGHPESMVRKVAVCGGSGAELWTDALGSGADTYVTGDVKYHTAQDMLGAGLKFVDAGHYGTEAAVLSTLCDYLQGRFRAENMAVEVLLSQTNTDPFAYL